MSAMTENVVMFAAPFWVEADAGAWGTPSGAKLSVIRQQSEGQRAVTAITKLRISGGDRSL